MFNYLIKILFFYILIFVLVLLTILFVTNYLSKKIFTISEEINNLIIEKETRMNTSKEVLQVKSYFKQLERNYNIDLKKEFALNKINNNQIIEFASSNKINLSISDSKLLFLDSLDNFLKLKDFLKKNQLEIDFIKANKLEDKLKIEIKLK